MENFMGKLIMVLIFFTTYSSSVLGNDNNILEPLNSLEFYKSNKISFGLNISPDDTTWHQCQNYSSNKNNFYTMQNNISNPICESLEFQESKNFFVGLEIIKKDSKNRFSISLQGGFNFGVRNETRKDGTQKIRVHANIKGKYDLGIMKGRYKGVFRFVTPGSTPYSNDSMFADNSHMMFNRNHKMDGLIFNKDIYIGIELTY
jgi:hypothetical protein